MLHLRPFTEADVDAIRINQYPDASEEEILQMLHDWNAGSFQGNAFEMFAVLCGDALVGSVSIFQRSQTLASLGVEIYPAYRQRGFASQAMRLALDHAKKAGYKIVQDQVRTDNVASIRLHERLSFESDRCIYTNRKEHAVYLFLKAL